MQAFCLPFYSSFFLLTHPFLLFLSFCILQVLIMLFIFYLLHNLQFLYICSISFYTKNFVLYLPLKKIYKFWNCCYYIFMFVYIYYFPSRGMFLVLLQFFLLFSLLLFSHLLFLLSILSVCLKHVLTLWPRLMFTLPVDPSQDSSSW